MSRVTLPPDFLRLGRRALVIAGGESGRRDLVRPTHPDDLRSLRDQCEPAEVWYDFKQWGEYMPLDHAAAAGIRMSIVDAMNANTLGRGYVAVGKKRAGRVLDGRTHDGVPSATS